MAITRISQAVVKRLLGAALNTAFPSTLRFKSEPDQAHPDMVEEAVVRLKVGRLTITPRPRRLVEGEPDTAALRLEVRVMVSAAKVIADGDDAIDEAVDALNAALDQPDALIDAATSTRIELKRVTRDDEPAGENERECSALCVVEGEVIRTP